ncbi:hypothetical protein Vadar_023670 [Vaccinium darrowii]|uniref:Uncharacterized protein n=1 Tax=Vaccinium darrowii TaxID=229202 RepID=A0ACB7XTB8_9ERIC|nr:hypothetical protein Vadar_023670 [Vaccinium darrowii]
MMQRPNGPKHFACWVCDKVCVGTDDMVSHFQTSHMRDNMIVHGEMDLKPYPNYHLDKVPNFMGRNLSEQNPNPNTTSHGGFQPLPHDPSIDQKPNFVASQVPSIQVTGNSNRQIFPNMPPSLNEIKPEPQPTSPVPGAGGYIFQPSSSPASPTLPFGIRYHTSSDKTSVQEVDHLFGVTNPGHDLTKSLIDKLERPISEAAKGLESNDERFNSEIDLTLKL